VITIGLMGIIIMGNLPMVNDMVMVLLNILMVNLIEGHFKMIKKVDLVKKHFSKICIIRESFKMI